MGFLHNDNVLSLPGPKSKGLSATFFQAPVNLTVPYNTAERSLGTITAQEDVLPKITFLGNPFGRFPGPLALPSGGVGGAYSLRENGKRYSKLRVWYKQYEVFYQPPPMETFLASVTFSMTGTNGDLGDKVDPVYNIAFVPGPAYNPFPPPPKPLTPEEAMNQAGLALPASDADKFSYLIKAVSDVLDQMMKSSGAILAPSMSATPLKFFLGETLCSCLVEIASKGAASQLASPFSSWADSLLADFQAGTPKSEVGRNIPPIPPQSLSERQDKFTPTGILSSGVDFESDPGMLGDSQAIFEAPPFAASDAKTPYMWYFEYLTGDSLSPRYLFNDPTGNPHALIQNFADPSLTWAQMLPQAYALATQQRDFLRGTGFKGLGKNWGSFGAYLQSSPSLSSYYSKALAGQIWFRPLYRDIVELYRWKIGEKFVVVHVTPYVLWDTTNMSAPISKVWVMSVDYEKVPSEGLSLLEQIGFGLLLAGVGAISGGTAAAVVAALGPALIAGTALIGAYGGALIGSAFGEAELQQSGNLNQAIQTSAIAGGITGAVVGVVADAAALLGSGSNPALTSAVEKVTGTVTTKAVALTTSVASTAAITKLKSVLGLTPAPVKKAVPGGDVFAVIQAPENQNTNLWVAGGVLGLLAVMKR